MKLDNMDERKRNFVEAMMSVLPFTSSASVLYMVYIAWRFLFYPKLSDAPRIYDFCVLIGAEFILVIANFVLSAIAMNRFSKKSLAAFCISLLFFVPFLYCMSLYMIDISAMKSIIVCMVVSHLVEMLLYSQQEKRQIVGYFLLRLMLYFFILIFCAIFNSLLPRFGLSESFLQTAKYDEINQRGGIILDYPNVGVIIGLLYYGIMSLAKVYNTLNNIFGFHWSHLLFAKINTKLDTLQAKIDVQKKRKRR